MKNVAKLQITPWVAFAVYWLLGFVAAYLSQYLFIEEAVKRAFATFSAPVIADWLYPAWNGERPPRPLAGETPAELADEGAPRAPITLALLTDDDLLAYGATYPVPYGFHADRLDTLIAHGPSALFIDIAFIDARPDTSIGDLVELLCHARNDRKIPVFVASLEYAGQAMRTELEKAAGEGCFEKVTVPRQLDRYDRNNWEYVLQTEHDGRLLDSPALAIHKALRPDSPLSARQEPLDNLGLIWGLAPHRYNVLRMRDRNEKPLCRTDWQLMREIPLLGELVDRQLNDAYAALRQLPFCPYHASAPLHFLSEKPEVMRQLVAGRVVVYGVDLQSIGDYTFSPLHGAIAGPYAHAMALDNLLTFGDAYPRAQEFDLSRPLTAGTLFPLLMVTIAAAVAALTQSIRNREALRPPMPRELAPIAPDPAQRHPLWKAVARTAVAIFADIACRAPRYLFWFAVRIGGYLLALLAVGWIAMNVFNLGILSWLEYALLPMLLETLAAGDSLSEYVQEKWEEADNKTVFYDSNISNDD